MYDLNFNNPKVSLNKDFIGVWDDVIKEDFNSFIIDTIDNCVHIQGRNKFYVQDKQINLESFNPQATQHILSAVRICLEEYIEWYPFLGDWNFHSSGCLLQKTEPTQGYHSFHSETSELSNA